MTRLTVLSVAHPFAAVAADAVGCAERTLSMLDQALVGAGHRSVVVASSASVCAGELLAIPHQAGAIEELRAAHAAVARTVDGAVEEVRPDVVHFHGFDFHAYLPQRDVPVLVTLHLPLDRYPRHALVPARRRTWLNGVSAAQMRAAPPEMPRVAHVPYGVRLDLFAPVDASRRRYAMAVGRVSHEEGFDRALDAAQRVARPMILAGGIFLCEGDRRYFRDCISPRLRVGCRFVGAVGVARRRALLARARCLVVPSRQHDASSLAAIEALACGTPVVALRMGGVPELVEHGRTRLVVDDVDSMARALLDVAEIDGRACRESAERRFGGSRMTRAYFDVYERLAASRGVEAPAPGTGTVVAPPPAVTAGMRRE